jgi:hypothetical protein
VELVGGISGIGIIYEQEVKEEKWKILFIFSSEE